MGIEKQQYDFLWGLENISFKPKQDTALQPFEDQRARTVIVVIMLLIKVAMWNSVCSCRWNLFHGCDSLPM